MPYVTTKPLNRVNLAYGVNWSSANHAICYNETPYPKMPARIYSIHRIMLAVQIRLLIELGIAAGEGAKLRVVVPATNFEQTGITVGFHRKASPQSTVIGSGDPSFRIKRRCLINCKPQSRD